MPSNEPASESTVENTISSAEPSIFERLVAAQRNLNALEAQVEQCKTIVGSLKEAAEVELSSLGISTVRLNDGSNIKVLLFTEWSLRKETKTEFVRLALSDFEAIVTVNAKTAGSFYKNSEPEVQERILKYFSKYEGKKVKVSVCG